MRSVGTSARERFAAFCSQADAAAYRRVTRESPGTALRIGLSNPDATEILVPDQELFRLFLADLRPFILPGGDIDFEAVNELLQRTLAPGELLEANTHNRRIWGEIMRGDGEPVLRLGATVYHPNVYVWLLHDRFRPPGNRGKAAFGKLPRFHQQYAEFGFAIDVGRAAAAQAAIIRRAFTENAFRPADD